MEAILKFSLPDEREEFDRHLKAVDEATTYRGALESLREAFRQKAKYAEPHETTWAEAKQLFWDTLLAEGVELD